MLSINSIKVLSYLKNHFDKTNKAVTIFDVNIENLSLPEILAAFEELEENRLIILNKQYIQPSVEGLI